MKSFFQAFDSETSFFKNFLNRKKLFLNFFIKKLFSELLTLFILALFLWWFFFQIIFF